MFNWSPKCVKAFEDLKSYLTSPPILSKSKDEEELYVCLVAFTHAVSSVLVRIEEIEERTQKLVYYVSYALEDAKTKYSNIDKLALALALFVSSKKGATILSKSYHHGDYILPIMSNVV